MIPIIKFLIIVSLSNQKCMDCGAIGDVRLMPNYCHQEVEYKHPQNTSRYHPKGNVCFSKNKLMKLSINDY